MLLLHATPIRNAGRIERQGLRCARSKCAAKTIYLASKGQFAAAMAHACRRHKCEPEAVAVFLVAVPRSWLRKGGRKAVWHTGGRDVPPERVLARYTVELEGLQ